MLQQLGRGGRDGKHTECVVYYDKLERAETSSNMQKVLNSSCIRVSILLLKSDSSKEQQQCSRVVLHRKYNRINVTAI